MFPKVRHNIVVSTFSCNKQQIDLWHFCLGHPSHDRLAVIKQSFPSIFSNKSFICDTCHCAKQKKLPFSNSTSLSPKPFSLIHVDIWDPCASHSMNGHKYFLTIINDHSRYVWVILMSTKSETQQHLKDFITLMEKQFDTKIKAIQSDNGAEFIMK